MRLYSIPKGRREPATHGRREKAPPRIWLPWRTLCGREIREEMKWKPVGNGTPTCKKCLYVLGQGR